MTRYGFTDGRKAATLGDLDEFMDWLVSEGQGDGTIGVSEAAQKVAFVYRSVRLIADAVRGAPWQIVRQGEAGVVFDKSDDYQNALGWLPQPKRVLELVARSLLGPGSAYLFRVQRGRLVEDVRYMLASSITPVIDGEAGLVAFKRKVNGKELTYPVERFVYFWPADEAVELGPPKSSPVTAALMAAGADYYTSKFVAAHFAGGAIKGTILAVKGNPHDDEKKRLKEKFTRTFFRGIASAFGVEIINADTVVPVTIGEGLEALNNSELTLQMREDIAVALGVPMSKLLSSTIAGMGGGGVAESDDVNFYSDTVRPLGEFIASVLNEQVFADLGLRWEFLWDTLDVFQQDEKERSVAFKTYVDARMKPEIAAAMLGLEIPEDAQIPAHYADAFTEEPAPMLPFGMGGAPAEGEEPADKEQAAEIAKERAETTGATRAADLERWARKAVRRFEEGHPDKALEFESALIPEESQAAIRYALGICATSADAADVFMHVIGKGAAFTPEPRKGPLPEQEEAEDEAPIDAADLKAWDKALPDFAGLLDADVINREHYDASEEM